MGLLLQEIFSFTTLNILSALLIFVIGVISIIYNKILSNSFTRNLIVSSVVLFSMLTIFSVNYIVVFIGVETISGLCFVLVLLSKQVRRQIAISYFIIHGFAGILMMIAIMMNYNEVQSFQIVKTVNITSLKEIILLTSLVINTALFPFFNWYTKTYSRVDPFSLIILSAITTKTAFFIMWKIVPGSNLLFNIGLITLITSMVLALITTNVLKFLLLISISSMGFTSMAISYHGFLITGGIIEEIQSQLLWYISSSVFSICGFLVLYGFIINKECASRSFASMKLYFQENGSSVHFVISAFVFALCFAAFPFTASFIAKTNISKFFVNEHLAYYIIKSSSVIFIIFAIKLVVPVFHSVEFLKLDVKGKKLVLILYIFVAFLVLINLLSWFFMKVKFTFFIISVEFFTFIAYAVIAGILLFVLDFILKFTNLKYIIEMILEKLHSVKILTLFLIHKASSKIHKINDLINHKKGDIAEILSFSKVTPSFSLIAILVLFLIFNLV